MLEKIFMQEFLNGGLIDRLIKERAPSVVKTYSLVIMSYLGGSEKSAQKVYCWYLVENRCILSL